MYESNLNELIKHIEFAKRRKVLINRTINTGRHILNESYLGNFRHFENESNKKTYYLGIDSFYLLDEAVARLSKNPKILNLGSGDGADLLTIKSAMKNKKATIIGTDISLAACKSAAQTLNLPILWADSRNLNIKDKSFNMVADRNTLAFIEDDIEFLMEQNRILKKGGILVLSASMKK